ncbi:MAG: hypothetical protein ACC661_04485 [Verrucomicrobiales bacterium]
MITHAWRERTEEGELRFVRAQKHGGRWRLHSRLKSEEEWTRHDPMELHDLESLRDVLWRKYQRKRLPFGDVAQIDELIAECKKV